MVDNVQDLHVMQNHFPVSLEDKMSDKESNEENSAEFQTVTCSFVVDKHILQWICRRCVIWKVVAYSVSLLYQAGILGLAHTRFE